MPTRSLIGVLDPDGRTFQARHCHFDGHPRSQLPALAEAVHKFHDGEADRLAQRILDHDWVFIDAAEASAEYRDPQARGGRRSPYEQPCAGVGYYYTDGDPKPVTGSLDDQEDAFVEWLYLFTGDQLRVFYADEGWQPFGDFALTDLLHLDNTELVARESAIHVG